MQKLNIGGKAYDLAMTVGAFAEISEFCPGGDFSRIGELLGGGTGRAFEASARMIAAMSRGAEAQKSFENPEYAAAPLTLDQLRVLPVKEYSRIFADFYAVLSAEMKGKTVEVEPSKKKETGAEA